MEFRQEQTRSTDYTVLMEADAGGRVKTEYRSLRRQVCCLYFMTVFLCLACCLFTVIYQNYSASCMGNNIAESPAIAMQKQAPESSSEEASQEQRVTPFIRLSVDGRSVSGPGNVTWKLMPDSVETGYFSLDDDNESLVVRQDGTYKVSLQMMYKGTTEQHYGKILLQHEIYCYTDRYPKALRMLVYEESVNFKGIAWKKTLFSEGVYAFRAGDRLKVWSHNRSLIDKGGAVSQKTFLVAYPLFSS